MNLPTMRGLIMMMVMSVRELAVHIERQYTNEIAIAQDEYLSDVFALAFILFHFGTDRIVIHILDRARDGTRPAIANFTEVDLAQANALRRGSAHEDFIRNIKLIA